MTEMNKWVAVWGNATSIIDQKECVYAKNITLRYPMRMVFNARAMRFRFSNLTGTEPVTLRASFAKATGDRTVDPETVQVITVNGSEEITIEPGKEVTSDVLEMNVTSGDMCAASIYVKDATQMNAGVLQTGPLSKASYSYGNFYKEADLPMDLTRGTNWFWFLNTVEVLTEEKNHCLVCYGDSITAQDWPDYLAIRAWENGYHNVSIIRRAVSGTRILREYTCTTYAAYGLKGETRFPIEIEAAGADEVIIQHGINDIIHPVGAENNPWRPWSDLPTAEDLCEGVKKFYLPYAREKGMKIYGGTLIPIEGWRTYAPFRDEIKDGYNAWLRSAEGTDGCVDFDLAVRDPERPSRFAVQYDSGDHLHPSAEGYKAMAYAVPEELINY